MYKKLFSLLLIPALLITLLLPVFAQEEKEAAEAQRTITIQSEEEFLEFAENCRIDSYSENLSVKLQKDLDLSRFDFRGIPIFCGSFDGENHKIKNLNMTGDGSYQGLFRYVAQGASVKNLAVSGTVEPGGSQSNVGGIAGSNAGTLENCSFQGTVSGKDGIGGIVGLNTLSGKIVNCRSQGTIRASHRIGGIAGENLGVLDHCQNDCQVNTSAQDNTLKVTSITMETLTGTEDPHTVTDVGGIAGMSSGVIRDCRNRGDVGYLHMGYNLGGIAGTNSGYVTGCKNHGDIFGRKETGGIVGQFIPAQKVEYSLDTLQILEQQLSAASSRLNQATYNAQHNMGVVGEGLGYLQEDSDLARDAVSALLQGYHDADPDSILAAKNALGDSLYNMESSMGYLGEAAGGTVGQLSRDLRAVANQLSAMSATLRNAQEDTGVSLTDVSDLDTPEDLTGKISDCHNYGQVSGDINTGGIAGSIGFESQEDPEEGVVVQGERSLNARGQLRAVILQCSNRGKISGKRLHTGGIVGFATLGLMKECVNTGSVRGTASQYIGGIAGRSMGYLRSCHVKAKIGGQSYVGGIAGSGSVASDCLSMVLIEDADERLGAILGVSEEPRDTELSQPLKNNFYMSLSQDPGGIDSISYRGQAEPLPPALFLGREGLPQAFQKTTLTFRYEDGTERELVLPVGSRLKPGQLPNLPLKEGYIASWEDQEEYEGQKIYFDRVFHPLYEPSRITIRSPQVRSSGRPVLLAEGLFPDTGEITMAVMDRPVIDGKQALEAWTLPLFSETESTVLHYTYPEELEPEYLQVNLQNSDGSWQAVPFTVKGSCLVFSAAPGQTALCLSSLPDFRIYGWIAGSIGTLAAVLGLIAIRNRRKKKSPQA